MIGNIRRPNINKTSTDPDDYFDPTTHIATEDNFIKFLNAGIYTSNVIGYKVVLSNSVDYDNGTWVIADLNHDSANTGQTNCYDLISLDCFHQMSTDSQIQRSTNIRTQLNNTFYPEFSTNIKNHILNIKYNSGNNQYNDDKIILPSATELNTNQSYQYTEGIGYSIFPNDGSRARSDQYFTRSQNTMNTMGLQYIRTYGDFKYNTYYYLTSMSLTPIIRVS